MILAIFTSLTERQIRGMKEGERNDDGRETEDGKGTECAGGK